MQGGWTRMNFIQILDNDQEEHERGEGDFASWSRSTAHSIQGFREAKEGEYHDLVVSFKPEKNRNYFLLYVLYGSGDSFGRSTGNIVFVGLYEDEALAEENAKRIADHAEAYKKGKAEDEFSVTLKEDDAAESKMSTSWNGYFERVEDIVVERISSEAKKSFMRHNSG
jgi:hypothetical protein